MSDPGRVSEQPIVRVLYVYTVANNNIRKPTDMHYAYVEIAGEDFMVHISSTAMRKLIDSGVEQVSRKDHLLRMLLRRSR